MPPVLSWMNSVSSPSSRPLSAVTTPRTVTTVPIGKRLASSMARS
jgi:hypothetical protein